MASQAERVETEPLKSRLGVDEGGVRDELATSIKTDAAPRPSCS
jgi:hypothetical protein